jgi:hypothetical protein
MWLWARCCSLLLKHWWTRGREKADVVWVRFRYSLTTTGTSLTQNSPWSIERRLKHKTQNSPSFPLQLLVWNGMVRVLFRGWDGLRFCLVGWNVCVSVNVYALFIYLLFCLPRWLLKCFNNIKVMFFNYETVDLTGLCIILVPNFACGIGTCTKFYPQDMCRQVGICSARFKSDPLPSLVLFILFRLCIKF